MTDERATELGRTARGQLALFTRAQAIGVGYPERTVDRYVAGGRWERWALNVYGAPGLPRTSRRRVLAAVLSAGRGAAASRRTAASFLGLQREPDTPSIVVPYRQRGPVQANGVKVHRSRTLELEEILTVRDVPTTTPDRTLADLSLEDHPARIRELMARALQRGVTDRTTLTHRAELLRGRPGGSVFRRALYGLVEGASRARSHPELELAERMIGSGLPAPEIGYEVREDNGRLIAELDLAYPWCKLAVEVDGFIWHSTPDRKHYDEVRQNRLILRGWRVLRFSVEDIRRRPEWVVKQIAAALSSS